MAHAVGLKQISGLIGSTFVTVRSLPGLLVIGNSSARCVVRTRVIKREAHAIQLAQNPSSESIPPHSVSMTLLRTLLLRSRTQAAVSSPPPIPQPPSLPPSPSRRRPPDARRGAHTLARSNTEGTRPPRADSVGARAGSFAHRFRASMRPRPLLGADGAVAQHARTPSDCTREASEAALAGPSLAPALSARLYPLQRQRQHRRRHRWHQQRRKLY